ncbi:MAG TPA: sulfatase-like hydrolase/transferase [Devosiaceae bacterium]|jgi:arylsulfatase A-like enzyme
MPTTRPNVLLITADEWPGTLLGCAGHPAIETPTLDALARSGTRFSRAYSECPVCMPARRSLMTGMSPRAHGDRVFQGKLAMPSTPTLADAFVEAGYQAYAVGKLHVYPPRSRIGFHDVMLAEEGRQVDGAIDDYEQFLAERGHAGRQFMHGMGNNEYVWRSWHLPEDTHPTNWQTDTAARMIKRRDPTKPGFWYVSYTHPHPPLAPLREYLERYAGKPMDPAVFGDWSSPEKTLPPVLDYVRRHWAYFTPEQVADIRRAFYALCTHIDHQLRVLIGTLREEGILDDTIILFTSDHGDMLGDHGLFAKRLMYEKSANIPMLLSPGRFAPAAARQVDDRLVGLQDVMPTLLELCGIPVPEHCTGRSMLTGERRDLMYCECVAGLEANRMVHDGRYKLIWYPAGNTVQVFDIETDPLEIDDLAASAGHADIRERLTARLIAELYGEDLDWVSDGKLTGFVPNHSLPTHDRDLYLQRGLQYPPPRA